ncbi:triphosphoribosyl-dephospho-CoA synthase MdcB [Afifella sp. IM 167]|uniref:triphosphoribosyl-dephospho-CoA synthase MdcB n=1 Tax=Afifella sp. IM 167 TaxID=2033586 RepID=UPI001CCAF03F|nr:triphosphoribosyl-dephospho-CoA synthase MdcB [Afifella sp. IM 167]MBZ8132409.1 triphosphoribosyl-dephospho-CoA synthase MdcB [Afifella sp. IM 167]
MYLVQQLGETTGERAKGPKGAQGALTPLVWQIGSAFLAGTLLEVAAHPKPGLVTPRSNGSHRDMDIRTFMVSSAAIAPCFYECADAGLRHDGPLAALLPAVRAIGCRYEGLLLSATGGVNTQRGFLFSAGILSAAAGHLGRDGDGFDTGSLFATAALMSEGLCARELTGAAGREPHTAGEWLFRRYRVLGIRGEVEAGFPTVAVAGLPAFEAALEKGAPLHTALIHTLIALMAVAEDTTVLWRGGPKALDFVRNRAREVLRLGGALTAEGMAAIRRLDADCIARNLSPGGSADLLAVTYGVDALQRGGALRPAAPSDQPRTASQSPTPSRIS